VNKKLKKIKNIGIMVLIESCKKKGFYERHSENARVHKVAFKKNEKRDMRKMWKDNGGKEYKFIKDVKNMMMKVKEFYKCEKIVKKMLIDYKEDLEINVGLVNMELHKMGITG